MSLTQEYTSFINTPEGKLYLESIRRRVDEAIAFLENKSFHFVTTINLLRNIIKTSEKVNNWKQRHSFAKAFFEILNRPQIEEVFARNKWYTQLFIEEVTKKLEYLKNSPLDTTGSVFYNSNVELMEKTSNLVSRLAIL